jgi:hypothetical protein
MNMKKLVIICEGKTEVAFVNYSLRGYSNLSERFVVIPVTMPTGKNPAGGDSKGGWWRSKGYGHCVSEIGKFISLHKGSVVTTTFFDLYRFPSDIPCFCDAANIPDPVKKAEAYERQMKEDVAEKYGDVIFLPHIQPYEFEALMFADPSTTAEQISLVGKSTKDSQSELQAKLTKVITDAKFPSPEHINNKRPPSKRLEEIIPGYVKNKVGRGGFSWKSVEAIGIDVIRSECRHFNNWMEELEKL